MRINNYKHIGAVLLLLIICLNVAFNFLFLKAGPTYLEVCDQIHHLNGKTNFAHQLTKVINNGDSFFDKLKEGAALFNTCSWPRLVYFATAILNFIFGQSTFATEMGNILYLVILLVSVYLIGKECFVDSYAGILAAFVLSCFPIIRQYSVAYGLDLPLASFTALCMLFLLRADNFKKTSYSVLFGIILGLSILIKGQIIIFLFGPMCYIASNMARRKEGRPLLNLFSSLIISALISSVWWQGQLSGLYKDVLWVAFNNSMSTDCKWPVSQWPFYYFMQTIKGVNIPLFIVFLLSFVVFIRSKEIRNKALLLLWLFVPYLILSCLRTKWDRFFLPSLSVVALITSYGFLKITNRKYRQAAVILLVVFGLQVCLNIYWNRESDNYEKMVGILVDTIRCESKTDNPKIGIIEDGDFNMNREAGLIRYLINLNLPSAQIYLSRDNHTGFLVNCKDFDFVIFGYNSRARHAFPKIIVNAREKDDPGSAYFYDKDELIRLLEGTDRWLYSKEVILSPDKVYTLLFKSRK